MNSVSSVPLSDVLHSYRVGITVSRFLKKQQPLEADFATSQTEAENVSDLINDTDSTSEPASDLTPEHNAFILKNQNLGEDLNYLPIQTIDTKPMSLKLLPILDKHRLAPGDVLATIRFLVFWVAYLQPMSESLPLYAYNNLAVLKLNQDLILPEYLTLWLRSHSAQSQIHRLASQVTKAGRKLGHNFSAIDLAQLVSIVIPLPSLTKQRFLVDEFHDIVANQLRFEQLILQRHASLQQQLLLLDEHHHALPHSLGVAQVGNYALYRSRLNLVNLDSL
jgi:hypothetical protein